MMKSLSFYFYLLIIFIQMIFVCNSFAEFVISDVQVLCKHSPICKDSTQQFQGLIGKYASEEHFAMLLNKYKQDAEYSEFKYELDQSSNQGLLKISITPLPIVGKVIIDYTNELVKTDYRDYLSLREGMFFLPDKLNSDVNFLTEKFTNTGYDKVKIESQVTSQTSGVLNLIYRINLGKPRIVESIEYTCSSPRILEILKINTGRYKNKKFDKEVFLQSLQESELILRSQGYYQIKLSNSFVTNEAQNIFLKITCIDEALLAIDFEDQLKIYEKKDLIEDFRKIFTKTQKTALRKELASFLKSKYQERGRDIDVSIVEVEKGPKFLPPLRSLESEVVFQIMVKPFKKIRVKNINFRGNVFVSDTDLDSFYHENGSDLSRAGFYDSAYIDSFIDKLLQKYVEYGFMLAQVSFIARDTEDLQKELFFDVQEGTRTSIRSFQIKGIEDHFELINPIIKRHFKSPIGAPFNPILFEEEIKSFLKEVQESGFYFAKYVNFKDETISKYFSGVEQVDLLLELNLGPRIRFDRLYITGNFKTKTSVIERKLSLSRDAWITPSFMERINNTITSLGLFKSFRVEILEFDKGEMHRDIYVALKERDFGSLEFAPGFRSDLGLKLSSKLIYSNLFGLNQSLVFEGEINERINKQGLDDTRKAREDDQLEYEFKVNYLFPDIFKSYWDYSTSLSLSRRRYYSFDADVERYSNNFSRELPWDMLFSFGQQLENITQYGSTERKNDGNYRIGSITPGLSLDKRNNVAFPTKGYFFNINTELAKPEFLSKKSGPYEINYYKLVTRSKMYFPVTPQFIVATSLTFGLQENLSKNNLYDNNGVQQYVDGEPAKEGFIPSIKVFRLTGIDNVRGFADDEINILRDGRDITQVFIQNRVFLTSLKLEPRYMVRDDLAVGVFMDAGRVQVDSFEPSDLRSSVGVSLKYLTPVGTLDLDYGVKLSRQKGLNDKLESPGRIHVSIGFF
ncbi:MAG: BamA/TamA family outer membrane protein [Bacteriovoracaceae bacterium]|nr:BamA/TamA family outer membrane protein [Bacteriovoracaceae bacterium]